MMGSGEVLNSSGRVQMLTGMHEDGWLVDELLAEDSLHYIYGIITEMLDDLDIYGPEEDPLDGSSSNIVDSENHEHSVKYIEGVKLFDAKYYGMDDTTSKAVNGLHLRDCQVDIVSMDGIVVNKVTLIPIVEDVKAKVCSSNKLGEHHMVMYASRKVEEAENNLSEVSEEDDFDKTPLHHYEEFKLFDATRYDMIVAGEFLDFGKDAYDVKFC